MHGTRGAALDGTQEVLPGQHDSVTYDSDNARYVAGFTSQLETRKKKRHAGIRSLRNLSGGPDRVTHEKREQSISKLEMRLQVTPKSPRCPRDAQGLPDGACSERRAHFHSWVPTEIKAPHPPQTGRANI